MPGASALQKTTPVRTLKASLTQFKPRFSGLPAQPIASGGAGVPNTPASVTSVTNGCTTRSAYKAAVDCTDLQLVFPIGFYLNSSGAIGETAMASVQLPGLKAAIEYNGTIYPVLFNGARSVNVDPWGTVTSDPLALEIPAGAVFYVRAYLATGNTATTNIPLPRAYPAHGPGVTISGNVGFNRGGDFVDADGGTWSVDLNYSYIAPIACGQPTGTRKATIAILGDSITGGVGSLNGSSPWWKYGLNNAFPVVHYTRASIAAQGDAAAHQHGLPLLQGLNYAIVMYGTNDYQVRTLVQAQADLTTVWTALANRGIKVYAATLIPGSSSSDSWVTTTNQAPKTGEAIRTGINDWIRSKPAPLTGFIETADVCETARNSGLWKVNGTANYATPDGIHPSDAFHQLMGAAINTAVFTV